MCLKEASAILGLSIGVVLIGSFITYPPYARLAGLTVFFIGMSLLALRKNDVKAVSEKGLEGDSGKSAELLGENIVDKKSKSKKWHRKKARRSKTK